jgi:hypothetical protein
MKNKKVKLGVLVLAAVTVFTATAFAASPDNSGYEALKQIMMDSRETEYLSGVSFNGTFKVSDKGTTIAEVNGAVKARHDSNEASGNIQVNLKGKEQDLAFFKNGEDMYLADKTNTKYYKLVNAEKEMSRRQEDNDGENYNAQVEHNMGSAEEALFDYLMGDLKSQFELSRNADGTKTITIDLNQNEIPASLNLLTAVAVESKGHNKYSENGSEMNSAQTQLLIEKLPFLKDFNGLEKDVPDLKKDVKLTALVIKLNVDSDNQLKSFETKISIAGQDADGISHEITFQGMASVSDINNTTVDKFNEAGKNIESINAEDFNCNR